MTSVYQRRVRQWGPGVLLTVAVLALIGGAVWRQRARERQAQADRDLFPALHPSAVIVDDDHPQAIPGPVEDALARGADPNARMPSLDPTPTPWQSLQAWFDQVGRHRPPPRRERPEVRVTALTFAVYSDDSAAVKALLDEGAAVDARTDNLPQVPSKLINDGNVTMTVNGQPTAIPFQLALVSDKYSDLLLPASSWSVHGITALMVASEQDTDTTSISLLLDHGANVNARDEDGGTALMNAAAMSVSDDPTSPNLKTIRLLLDRGAAINAQDRWGRTALMLAVDAERPAAIALLLTRGANTNLKDTGGQTAYARAAELIDRKEVQTLRRFGVMH